jgi:hypothetical protein
MNRIEVAYRGRQETFELPEAWEELTARQVKTVCRLYQQELNDYNFTLALCAAMMPKRVRRTVRRELGRLHGRAAGAMKAPLKKEAAEAATDFESQLLRLAGTLSFLKQAAAVRVNPYPSVWAGLHRLHGPTADLSACTYEQYAGADVRIRQFLRLRQHDAKAAQRSLLLGLACLWLPPARSAAQRRRAMQDEDIARRAGWIARLRPATLDAMLLAAQGGIAQVVERFPRVFTSDGSEGDGWGHAGVVLSLSGSKFGSVEETANTKLYTLLMYVDMKLEELEKRKNEKNA